MTKPDPSDAVWARAEIASPCVKLCVIAPESRLCIGCLRSIDEITAWSRMTDAARAEVMARLPDRAGEVAKRRGGRAARLKSRDR
ncbi:DUF1289 domain-containing protein [Roseisalinus antarcticus]|uniref:Fe-S protein n=1 Tax=Roseisalinus antarcticus TaxID=254357 RepID=A0A1Y5T9Q8_9RHOB|nr:DUF1289 domain-containing protein [Roseisalinus antarcticus]SLN55489.1 hypothetical protein ROA7023_02526 [Roseisalinus antarcticus]